MDDVYDVWGDDPTCGLDAKYQHLKHFFKGYRAGIRGQHGDDSPYSPGSARDFSWRSGQKVAAEDIAGLKAKAASDAAWVEEWHRVMNPKTYEMGE